MAHMYELESQESKLMLYIHTYIYMYIYGQKLETVTSFKYLGSVITDEGSKPEILSRIVQTTAALTRPKPVGMTGVFLSAPRYD